MSRDKKHKSGMPGWVTQSIEPVVRVSKFQAYSHQGAIVLSLNPETIETADAADSLNTVMI